jgi:sulfite reductase beta subunit-like hemoprotein
MPREELTPAPGTGIIATGIPAIGVPVVPVGTPIPSLEQLDNYQTARQALMIPDFAGAQIEQLQAIIAELQATVNQHTDDIARLQCAVKCLACPSAYMIKDDTIKEAERIASIDECMSSGGCNCELGFALTGGTWTPVEPA